MYYGIQTHAHTPTHPHSYIYILYCVYGGGALGGCIIVFGVRSPPPLRCCRADREAGSAAAAAGSGRYPGRAAAATADNIMRVYAPEGLARSLAAFERVAAPSLPS